MLKNITLIIIPIFLLCSCGKGEIKSSNISKEPDDLSGKKVYVNPTDGKTYKSEKKWKKYSPENIEIDTASVKMKQVILLTNQNKIPNCMSIDLLAEFIKKTEKIVKESMRGTDKKGEILIQFTLKDSKSPKINISSKEKVDKEKVSLIYSELEKLKDYKTQKDSVVFQTHYTINKAQ